MTSRIDSPLPSDLAARGGDLSSTPRIEQLEVVYGLTSALGRAADLDQIYQAAMDGLERALAAPRASILLVDDDGVMRFKAWRGLSERYRRAVEGHTPWRRDEP